MKNKLPTILITLATIFILGGCASKSINIPTTYVSPNQYASFSCPTLENEMRDISQRVATITGQVDKKASADSWQMGVGLVLFFLHFSF